MPAEPQIDDVKHLQRCINDLVSVLAFPAMWVGWSPPQIVSSFMDGLVRILNLDVAYIRLAGESGTATEFLKGPAAVDPAAGTWFAAQGADPAEWPRRATFTAGGHTLCIESLRLGLHSGQHLVAVGSHRRQFPLQTETLLLNVATNQLLLGLQEAQLRLKQKREAEEALNKTRTELVNIARITSFGVLTAAIAHEVNQPLSGIITNASACLRMLSAQPANIDGALETARRTIRDGKRAADMVARLRKLYLKKEMQPEPLDLNEIAREVVALLLTELQQNRVLVRYELAEDLPPVRGDRIQLQQVILNLLRNASDSMCAIEDRPRELLIKTKPGDAGTAALSVTDTGSGFSAQDAARMFEPFYTTKGDGMGIGLSVSRSIIDAHRGKLWATPNDGPGATFAFTVPGVSLP